MHRLKAIFGSIGLLLGLTLALATPVPMLDIKHLCEGADLIVVGKIETVRQVGESEMLVRNHWGRAHLMQAQMRVDYAVKGEVEPGQLSFGFIVPTPESLGYHGVPSATYQMVFLKRDGTNWDLADPFYPSFPAVPGTQKPEGDTFTRVVAILAATLDSGLASENDQAVVIRALGRAQTSVSTEALLRASQNTNRLVRISSMVELLQRDDTRVMTAAVDILSHPGDVPDYLIENLASGIAIGVRKPDAIPLLGKLLTLQDVRVRRAAATALGNTQTFPATPKLALALDDPDFRVRFYAVIGFAEITRQTKWHPSEDEFREHEQKYLAHWKEWVSARRVYPTPKTNEP